MNADLNQFPQRVSQLTLGNFYAVEGKGEGVEVLPAQIFQLREFGTMTRGQSTLLMGKLWTKVWISGRWWRNNTGMDSGILAHQVGIVEPGVTLNGKHDFHLRLLRNREEITATFQAGRAYGDYIDQTHIDEGVKA